MKSNEPLWIVGNVAALLVGVAVGSEHGLSTGFAVGYAISLLVDIRYECEQRGRP